MLSFCLAPRLHKSSLIHTPRGRLSLFQIVGLVYYQIHIRPARPAPSWLGRAFKGLACTVHCCLSVLNRLVGRSAPPSFPCLLFLYTVRGPIKCPRVSRRCPACLNHQQFHPFLAYTTTLHDYMIDPRTQSLSLARLKPRGPTSLPIAQNQTIQSIPRAQAPGTSNQSLHTPPSAHSSSSSSSFLLKMARRLLPYSDSSFFTPRCATSWKVLPLWIR